MLSNTERKKLDDQCLAFDRKVAGLDLIIRALAREGAPVKHLNAKRRVLMRKYQRLVYKLTDTPLPQ